MNKELEKPKKFEAIKYGDVFDVSGELAAKAITPQDAAAMESAEKNMFGETQKSGMARVMKSVAEINEERGVVGHDDTTEAIREGGTQITETTVVGHRVISESIGGQLWGDLLWMNDDQEVVLLVELLYHILLCKLGSI